MTLRNSVWNPVNLESNDYFTVSEKFGKFEFEFKLGFEFLTSTLNSLEWKLKTFESLIKVEI